MIMRVKICGITNTYDALSAVELGADALGFVFAKSPRQITIEQAREIIETLPPFISVVGVFVDEKIDKIKIICNSCGIHTVQLHGNEDPQFLNELKEYKIIKAFRIRDESDLKPMSNYKAHAFLLDSYVRGIIGGTGTTFNWAYAHQAKKYGNIILSGGLTPENVKDAVHIAKPFAVDVSSGVESSPGKKDKLLMKRFILNAKS